MELDNLASGLIGSVLGVLGAIALQWIEHRRQARAAARAVLFELNANAKALELVRDNGVLVPLSTTVWTTNQLVLSAALPPEDLVTVTRAYSRLSVFPKPDYLPSVASTEALQEGAAEAVTMLDEAIAALARHSWGSLGRKRATKALQELAARSGEGTAPPGATSRG